MATGTIGHEHLVNKCIKWVAPALGQAATTYSAGVFIPAGAVIREVKAVVDATAITNVTDASATFQLRVGTDPIISAITLKQLSTISAPVILTLSRSAGFYVPNSGELNLILQASANSSYVGAPTFYIEYYK